MRKKSNYRVLNLLLFFIVSHSISFTQNVWLVQDLKHSLDKSCKVPRNFRHFSFLNASGSGQFCDEGIAWLRLKTAGITGIIIDLRQESHAFLNGMPVSWYSTYNRANEGLSLFAIIEDEHRRIESLQNQFIVPLFRVIKSKKGSIDTETVELFTIVPVKQAISEATLVSRYGFTYYRLPVEDYHPPLVIEVDRFIEICKMLKPHAWIHLHCKAGIGRTTMFLAIYDIIRNAKTISLETIIERQQCGGGLNLFKQKNKQPWKMVLMRKRQQFLKDFYCYCKEQAPQFSLSWSRWIAKKRKNNSCYKVSGYSRVS